jgi:queuine tRNA-ribosyltransferase subunit QTRTD1
MSNGVPMGKLDQLPAEMLDFTLLKTAGSLAPRLGRLSFPGRKTILTPAFIGNTSRGVIPHVSQDNFRKSVNVGGVYVALEDCTYLDECRKAPLTVASRGEAPAQDSSSLQV